MYSIKFSLFVNLGFALSHSEPLLAYDRMFSVLDLSAIPDRFKAVGKKGYSIHAMIRALIVRHMERIDSVPHLIRYLEGNPFMAELCGFELGKIPHESQFYRLYKRLSPEMLEAVHDGINRALIKKGAVTLDTFIMDSKPVLAATKENNPKNADRNLTDKEKKPNRNPEATLGYFARQPDETKAFFWGFRTHVIISKEGIVLVTVTLPNTASDATIAIMLIKKLKKKFHFKKGAIFIADAAYDTNELFTFILVKLKSQAVFPENPRATQEPHAVGPNRRPICAAGLEMSSDGKWADIRRQAIKHKFRCPLKTSKSVAKLHPEGCPAGLEKYYGYGCTKYIQESYSPRASVNRNSKWFQDTLDQRIAVEQYFARMGLQEAYQTSHYSLRVVENQMFLAHISLSLVALAAVSVGQPEKMRCYRTFNQVA
jgi:hypothetical protein